MAEIFGVAAGAISVASIAIQIVDSLRIAIDFWEAVQHGHKKINRISTQLHILYDYMTEVQRECRNGQIQDSFSRKIGRVQIALKEGRLSRAKGYVESATNLLHLQSWQSHTMLQQMNSKIEVIFANSISAEKEPSHSSEISSSLPIPTSSEVPALAGLQVYHTYNGYSNMSQQLLTRFTSLTYINLFGFIDGSAIVTRTVYSNPAQLSNSPQGNKDAELYSSTKLTIKVLIKLSSYARGLRFQTNNLLNGYYLNSIRCIPNDSLIFKLCRSGDAQGMLKLFSAGMASSYDMDQNGKSLLHHACSSGKPDICRLLVDLGADIYQPDNYGWQVINKILFSILRQLRGDFSEIITLLCTQYEALQSHENNVYFDRSILLHRSVLRWCWAKENDDEQTDEVERKIEQILKLTKDLHRVDGNGHTALGLILRYASYDKSHTITLISN
ncbi:hypothetical protein V502_07075 [Pseudogymnoascus sp. VKM F-4520 (FW-2644)]|nr:hypothetical protein V502_07075 [Pseudogymnoascus sp. VKM F-4520 (FW-2644)]